MQILRQFPFQDVSQTLEVAEEMQTATFHGEIQEGRIVTTQPLTEFEGKQVIISLRVPDTVSDISMPAADSRKITPVPYAPEEAESLEDAGRIRMPNRETATVETQMTDVGRRPMPAYSSDEED